MAPQKEAECRNGEGQYSDVIETPVERGYVVVCKRGWKPFGTSYLNRDNVEPSQQSKHEHGQTCRLQVP
jgi:hypothetical protein